MQVAELEGAALDYWVAKAEGFEFAKVEDDLCWVTWVDCPDHPSDTGAVEEAYAASTDWMIAGPIIERETINLVYDDEATSSGPGRWTAKIGTSDTAGMHGPTLLTAALRTYVANKLGTQVGEVQIVTSAP